MQASILIDYLYCRQYKTGKKIQKSEPIFINHFNKPITEGGMRRSFRKLIRNSGFTSWLKNNKNVSQQYDFLRILLKSTLMAHGTDRKIADHVIGHKINKTFDSREMPKIAKMRLEYAKASDAINIFHKLQKIFDNPD